MLACTAIALLGIPASGAAGSAAGPSADSRAQALVGRVTAPVKCPSVRKALRFYTARWRHWTQLRGAPSILRSPSSAGGCPTYLLHVRQRKAFLAHREWNRWFHYQYVWSDWLPDKWQRIGACETGYGRRPGNWHHANSSYEGAFGFAKSSWDTFKYRADPKAGPYPENAYMATPRQQYEVALAIWRAYGFSGWGCAGA